MISQKETTEPRGKNELTILLVSAILLTLFLFFIDEGFYNFNWMTSVGNWIPFFIYVGVIYLGQLLFLKLLLKNYGGAGKMMLSAVGGAVLGTTVCVLFFLSSVSGQGLGENLTEKIWQSHQANSSITGRKAEVSDSKYDLTPKVYVPTTIPEDVSELYIEAGNKTSNTVLLIVQGGPFDKLEYTTEFDKWNHKLHIVFVKQAQILNHTILVPKGNLSLEDARYENSVSAEILHRVIQHFKNSDRKVLVWGVSYGAWVIQKYIGSYGIEADAIGLAAGRLDMEEEIWKTGTLNQTAYDISYDGDRRIYTKMMFRYTRPTSYLLAVITEERFTKTFENTSLSKLVVYQYGQKDGTVGRLNESEIEFLQSKNVEMEVCKRCYHRQMLSGKIANSAIRRMLEFVSGRS